MSVVLNSWQKEILYNQTGRKFHVRLGPSISDPLGQSIQLTLDCGCTFLCTLPCGIGGWGPLQFESRPVHDFLEGTIWELEEVYMNGEKIGEHRCPRD